MAERWARLTLMAAASQLLPCCALVSPLDPIRQAAPVKTCQGARCKDAGANMPAVDPLRDAAPASDATLPTPSDAAMDAMGAPDIEPQRCRVPVGAECDPISQCPCSAGTECGLDEQTLSVRCVPKRRGTQVQGEHCVNGFDCLSGMQCNADFLCARYCAKDDDCHGAGKCQEFKDPNTNTPIPGSATCSRWCDPFTAAECSEDSSCYATGADDPDPTATCRSFHDSTRRARGEACDWYNECERLLTCAEFGPRVCTSVCRSDAECPTQAPHCYMDFVVRLQSAPDRPIGQCVVWPCDRTTVETPASWSDGPVWNVDQHVECQKRCGLFSPDCFRNNCRDGQRWHTCFDTVMNACGGAIESACREQYVALTCSDFHRREPARVAFETCIEKQSDCIALAQRTCAESP